MEKILIVEDDSGLNLGLKRALEEQGRQILSCFTLCAARKMVKSEQFSLLLLDVNLPDGNGVDFLREVKAASPVLPVILLTANDTDLDIVSGLEQGADDYITKPFSLSVLRARVNTQLRKTSRDAVYREEGFRFDFGGLRFFTGDQEVQLSKTEQKLLRLLVENRGNVMPRETLLDRIWTDGAEYVDENALSVTVKRLRDKLGAQAYIKTVYGIGYLWVKKDA